MIEVYYYIPLSEVNYVVECGLKLSRWYDKEIEINGSTKKCISALLNPKDDMNKYQSLDYKCIKLEVEQGYCYVGDRFLYDVGMNFDEVLSLYQRHIVPVKNYIFGSFRLPECLVTTTVIGDYINPLDKRLDSPVLFENSEVLYINNIMETLREENSNFNDTMLYYFYCKLAQIGKIDKIEDKERRVAVFIDRDKNESVAVKIPDEEE